ncbi:synaptic vesicle glycoprotein 2C-like [Drosophila serrata]|uniref:synaptic vesicle glycoprotein 2C-like n=1 Tax=Drosophila serrata TaxID=7274 RepID=UPI000A1D0EE9|nr:synaptic vesicle glycoprotein 2C-like [Drosophila serrata]
MHGSLENRPKVWDYETVLEKIGYGKTQWILLLVSGLLTITTVAAQQAMGIIVIASQCDFHTTQAEKGVMMATRTAGLVLSTIIWGYISDDIGRRKVLVYGTFASNALQFSLMFVSDLWLFNFINFLAGISVGSVPAALYPYLGEFNIPRHRAVTINYSTMFVTVSAIIVPAAAWLILSYDWTITFGDFVFRPWRLMLLINLLPGLIGGLVLLYFPESPKFLLSQDRTQEAIEVVSWISKFNKGKPIQQVMDYEEFTLKSEDPEGERLLSDSQSGGILTKIVRANMPLFHKPHNLNFILCNLAVFGLFFGSCGVQVWLPDIVNKLSGDGNNSSTVCEILSVPVGAPQNVALEDCTVHISSKTYVDNLIVGFAFLFGFSIQGFLLNPLGRKNVLFAALGGAVLSGFLLHFIENPTGVLILFCLYILLPGLCISIMIGAIVDLVPTHLRSKAVSFCMSMGRLGVIASTNWIGIMLQPYCNTTFAIFTCTLIGCVIIVHYLPIKNST